MPRTKQSLAQDCFDNLFYLWQFLSSFTIVMISVLQGSVGSPTRCTRKDKFNFCSNGVCMIIKLKPRNGNVLISQDPVKSPLLYCWLHLSPKFHIKLTYLKSHLLRLTSIQLQYDFMYFLEKSLFIQPLNKKLSGKIIVLKPTVCQLNDFTIVGHCVLPAGLKHWTFIGLDDLQSWLPWNKGN